MMTESQIDLLRMAVETARAYADNARRLLELGRNPRHAETFITDAIAELDEILAQLA